MPYVDILRVPDAITAQTDEGGVQLSSLGGGRWGAGGVEVSTVASDHLRIAIDASNAALHRVHLRWHGDFGQGVRLLGDHWERGYGDFEWRGIVPERVMPWYFLSSDGNATHGYGVKTGASALCSWRADSSGVSLWLDVRSGGMGVQLGHRTLEAASVVTYHSSESETPFEAARTFCRRMCDAPRLPGHPVYGGNNWYYAYGRSSHSDIIRDTELLASYAPDHPNRPYMVIDAGWSPAAVDGDTIVNLCPGGPWDRGNQFFPDMSGLAQQMAQMGVRPGIWTRPLVVGPEYDRSLLLPDQRMKEPAAIAPTLDPSIPENLAIVEEDVRRLNSWGYTLIKHDFSTFDVLGRWGFEMGSEVTSPNWSFADRSRTTAEIILDLYRAIRRGAGDAVVIGCNTVGHLGAGLFELQRTGDDTSGIEWERTRKMGVNTLAFRMPQHDAFYAVDADCVGLTTNVPWMLNQQWLDLLARSGTPLFVSAAPNAVGPDQAQALRRAFRFAADYQAVGEPLDWMDTTCPARWKLADGQGSFDWFTPMGIDLA